MEIRVRPMPSGRARVALAAAMLVLPTSQALADRDPTPQERIQIEDALRAQGFVDWDDIEFDDEAWEVEDAVTRDGREFDLRLNWNFDVIERDD